YPEAQRAGLEFAIADSMVARNPKIEDALTALFDAPESRKLILETARRIKSIRTDLRILSAICDSLSSSDETLRSEALEIAQADASLQGNPAIRAALQDLTRDSNPKLAAIAAKLMAVASLIGSGAQTPDYNYFAKEVMPVFTR